MDWVLVTIGVVLTMAGIAGSLLPVLPGPPLNYLALLLIHLSDYHRFSDSFIISWLIITIAIVILDYLIPIYGAKLYGGSKAGIWGATIGLLVGVFFFPPFGMIVWSFIGAVLGELYMGKNIELSFKAGTGTFIGFLAGTIAKLVVSIIMAIYFFAAIF